jgi:hypothetical protein
MAERELPKLPPVNPNTLRWALNQHKISSNWKMMENGPCNRLYMLRVDW